MHEGEQSTKPSLNPKPGAPSLSRPRLARQGGDFDSKQSQPQLTTKRRGEVAEAAFLHKAAALGFSVAKPWGESDRYDFIVEVNGRCWRVQVKSAHTKPKVKEGYTFHACGNLPGQPYTAKDIDFFIAYVVPADAWYVLPIEVFAERRSLKVFPSSRRRRSRFEVYREAWHYLRTPEAPTQTK